MGLACAGQPKGRAIHHRVPGRKDAMIQQVRGIDSHIKIERIRQPQRPRH